MTTTEPAVLPDGVDERDVERFVHLEARLADEHDYAGWEALWTDDGVYRVPAAGDLDDRTRMAIIDDNRHRIATRVSQLETGRRHAQAPPSSMRRVVSNIEIRGADDHTGDLVVEANFVLVEAREQRTETWGGRTRYHLRPTPDGLRLAAKRVDLVNRRWVVGSLGFLI